MPKAEATRSIAFRLIVAVLAVEFASSLLIGILSFGYERHIHFRAFDTMLHGRVDSVLGAVQDAGDADDNVMLDKADLHLPAEDVYEVYAEDGRLLGRSPNWNGIGQIPVPQRGQDNFIHRAIDHRHYRLLVCHGTRTVDPGDPGGGKLHRVLVVYGVPTEHMWHAIRAAVEFYAAGSILLLAVTGPLIAWLLHRGLLPLRQLASLASQVSADSWEFSPPASAHATPELAPLTAALENVLQRLERSFTQQRTFISDSAHELKTAVAVVKSSLQLLALRSRTPIEYQAGIDRTLTDTERLEELVAKMLTLARVENGASEQAPVSATDLAASLPQVAADLAPVALLRRVTVAVSVPDESPALVPLVPENCSMLISNLILNAIQHSPPDSTVQARVVLSDELQPIAEFSVEDRGEGIDPAALPHVFERFYRGDPSRTRSTGGAGLGLAICKAVVERAGGSIAIASRPKEGTTVTVRLPLAREVAAKSALAPA